MHDTLVPQFAAVLVFGVGAQWLAWRLHLPSILMLLLSGFVAGPLLGWIDPDQLLPGGLMAALASLSVAVILFEGGLTLKLSELRSVGPAVVRLVTVGVLISWVLGALGAWVLFDLDAGLAALLGAILVLSGPTVVGPMLRDLRPRGAGGTALKWEGIVIDPVGAVLATLVLGVVVVGASRASVGATLLDAVLTLGVGGAIGALSSVVLLEALERRWVSESLQVPATLASVIAAFALANHFQHEAGLIAVTILGVALGNQRRVVIEQVFAFKEHLSGVLIASLFVLLAARVSPGEVGSRAFPGGVYFLAWLVLVVRPLSVAVSTWGTSLDWRQRVFLACVFPRGIVAAAVAPVFAIRLLDVGVAGAESIVPLCYLVIVGTAVIYGLGAPLASRLLGISDHNPQGVLLVGANPCGRAIAEALRDAGVSVALIDTNRRNIADARLAGLDAHFGNILSEDTLDELDLSAIGKLIALTPNDEVNALAGLRGAEIFGRDGVFQTHPEHKGGPVEEVPAAHLRGRVAFQDDLTHSQIASWLARGATVKRTQLSENFGFAEFRKHYGEAAIPLFYIEEDGTVLPSGPEESAPEEPGTEIVSLVLAAPDQTKLSGTAEAPSST